MTVARLRLAPVGEAMFLVAGGTMFPPRTPFFAGAEEGVHGGTRGSPTVQTVFPPRAPFFDYVREPPGSLTHPPPAHEPEVGR
jgi:hypothetical protein